MMSAVFLPPHPTRSCEWRLVCPVLVTTLWAGVLRSEPTCWSWKGWDNETLQDNKGISAGSQSQWSMYGKIHSLKYSMLSCFCLAGDVVDWQIIDNSHSKKWEISLSSDRTQSSNLRYN